MTKKWRGKHCRLCPNSGKISVKDNKFSAPEKVEVGQNYAAT